MDMKASNYQLIISTNTSNLITQQTTMSFILHNHRHITSSRVQFFSSVSISKQLVACTHQIKPGMVSCRSNLENDQTNPSLPISDRDTMEPNDPKSFYSQIRIPNGYNKRNNNNVNGRGGQQFATVQKLLLFRFYHLRTRVASDWSVSLCHNQLSGPE